MFKLSITSRWALMAARGWARLDLSGALSGGRNLPAPHAPWRGAKFCVSVLASPQIPSQSDRPEGPDATPCFVSALVLPFILQVLRLYMYEY